MSFKREHDEVDEVDESGPSEPEQKRARKARPKQSSSVDPNSGQKYVFATYHNATTIPVGEESDFEDDTDAMAYLMSVRTQASGIPHVLAAPKRQIGPQLPYDFVKIKQEGSDDGDIKVEEDDQVGRSIHSVGLSDARGFYEDGAYIGRDYFWNDDEGSDDWDEAEDEEGEASEAAVLEAYSRAIMHQYHRLRAILNRPPPVDAAKRITSSQATYAAAFGPGSTAIKVWPPLLRNTDPSPLQVSLMSKVTVIRVLRLMLGGKFLRRGYPLPERTSRWIWALLARLPERGELNHSEIGWVRDLGRRAVLLGRSLSEMAALREELAEGGLGVNDAVDASGSDDEVVADELDGSEGDGAPNRDEPEKMNDEPDQSAGKEGTVLAEEEGVEVAMNLEPDIDEVVADELGGPEEDGEPNRNEPEKTDGKPHQGTGKEGTEAAEEGEDDVAMDLESDSDEGEIREDKEEKGSENKESLEAAKAAFLARLDVQASDDEDDEKLDAVRERSRMNMRATLNMILTIVGEFYGQRDLLEFREPFVGM